MLQWKIQERTKAIQHHEQMIDIYKKQIQHKLDKMSLTHIYLERAKRELEILEINSRELLATQPVAGGL